MISRRKVLTFCQNEASSEKIWRRDICPQCSRLRPTLYLVKKSIKLTAHSKHHVLIVFYLWGGCQVCPIGGLLMGKMSRQLKIKLFNSTFQVVGNPRLVCLTLWKIITLGLHFKMSTEVKVADWDKSDFLTTPPIFFSLWRSPAFVPTKISILVLKTFLRVGDGLWPDFWAWEKRELLKYGLCKQEPP